jgi:Protein of unknown function (DUF2946)
MHRSAARSARTLRRIIACALIYALALQGIAFSLATARAAGVAGDVDWGGFELCHHGGDTSSQPGHAPDTPDDSGHCVFCFAAGPYVLGPPAFTPEFSTIVVAIVAWPFATWRLPAKAVDANARSRAPPRTT